MSEILIPAIRGVIEPQKSPSKTNASAKVPGLDSFSATRDASVSWGRRDHHGSWLHSLGCAGMMLFAPVVVVFWWIALSSFGGSLVATYMAMWAVDPLEFLRQFAPVPSLEASKVYVQWLAFQIALYQLLPSQISNGQLTPAGHLLQYRTNGLSAYFVTHALFLVLSWYGYLDPAVLAKNWEGLLVAMNISGFLLSGLAFIKAHVRPTHEGDRKFSGSMIYDLYMGVELNPRIGKYFDFKLFTNGRPGIVAWTLIDFSFIAYQFQTYGYVTNSILLATALHTVYVVDFFINEDWYLRTIDICHDHFGYYLAWGSLVWLPTMYTLQTQYLARNPNVLSNVYGFSVFFAGVGGYALFRSVNHQKNLARLTKGDCKIWGSPAEVVRVKYKTTDGQEHESMLLCSGWWGIARHVNYAGDLILSYSMCAACGTTALLPWTYAIFMTLLLVHRCWRDEERCSKKYGKGWEDYCKKVRWCILPGVW